MAASVNICSDIKIFGAGRRSESTSELPGELMRPLLLSRVAAGFPSPADDFLEGRIDLNKELVHHPLATYYVRVEGYSMIDEGIKPGTILLVDRSVDPRHGDIVIARVGNEMCVKQLEIGAENKIHLLSKNADFPPIEITAEMDFEVWGRVMYSITKH
jgi:DNA polymerase V